MNTTIDLYCAAGEYKKGDKKEFKIVGPFGGNPYVTPYPGVESNHSSLWTLTKHHAHLYKLDKDRRTLTLFELSGEAEGKVGAPKKVVLSEEDANQLKPWIGDVIICEGMPPKGNPHTRVKGIAISIEGNLRAKLLKDFRDGCLDPMYTVWYGPSGGPCWQMFQSHEVNWLHLRT